MAVAGSFSMNIIDIAARSVRAPKASVIRGAVISTSRGVRSITLRMRPLPIPGRLLRVFRYVLLRHAEGQRGSITALVAASVRRHWGIDTRDAATDCVCLLPLLLVPRGLMLLWDLL